MRAMDEIQRGDNINILDVKINEPIILSLDIIQRLQNLENLFLSGVPRFSDGGL